MHIDAMDRAACGAAVALLAGVLAGCGGSGSRDATSPAVTLPEELTAPVLDFRLEGWEKTDFAKHSVPFDEFLSGGPPKDGIPPIDAPHFVAVAETTYLESREPVIELTIRGETRAYPIQILIWHEIVNDVVGAVPVAVTFCPLCNTAIAFDRRVDGRTLDFGTTGKLRHSDLVMYDRQTESWWQQFGGEALVGDHTGTRLERLPARIVAWADFARAHPDARVLTRETGFDRSYGRNPYEGYDDVDSPPIFPVPGDERLPPKERVVYVGRAEESVAVPYSVLARRRTVRVELGGSTLVFRWRSGVASALDAAEIASGRDVGAADVTENGKRVAFSEPFWFAIAAFDPDVRIVER
ncbi:MAG: DUF3179 domain-containing protein [Actinobacteria bacterium]|nr:DUF3179 domain-containing protein [Actinomycetota bacterium]